MDVYIDSGLTDDGPQTNERLDRPPFTIYITRGPEGRVTGLEVHSALDTRLTLQTSEQFRRDHGEPR